MYFFVNMECCGTREEKIKLKICAFRNFIYRFWSTHGFGECMGSVDAWYE